MYHINELKKEKHMTTLEHAKEAFKNVLLVHDKNKPN